MKLSEALNAIHAPKGVTTLISAMMTGDFDSVKAQDATNISLEAAKEQLTKAQEAQNNCTSDWAYWGYMGDISYWTAVVDILEAAALVGNDNLPDIKAPNLEGHVVMDCCAIVERYGKEILSASKKKAA